MTIILDGNNLLNIAFFRAKSLKIKEMKDELKKNEEGTTSYNIIKNKYETEIEKYLTSFSVQIFLNILHKFIKDYKDAKFYLVWDSLGGSTWRKELSTTYKANRVKQKDNYFKYFIESAQIEEKILENYPIYQMRIDGAEADDIIYNLCNIIKDEIIVISSDGDFVQLSQKNKNIKIYNPVKKAFHKIPEYDIILFKAIKGDASDNIGGLYKFGEKKALKTIQQNLTNLTEEQKEIVKHNKILIDLSKNPNTEKNKEKVIKVLQNYKINVNTDKIQKIFFELKLKMFLKNWNSIKQLLFGLENNYERKKENKLD